MECTHFTADTFWCVLSLTVLIEPSLFLEMLLLLRSVVIFVFSASHIKFILYVGPNKGVTLSSICDNSFRSLSLQYSFLCNIFTSFHWDWWRLFSRYIWSAMSDFIISSLTTALQSSTSLTFSGWLASPL